MTKKEEAERLRLTALTAIYGLQSLIGQVDDDEMVLNFNSVICHAENGLIALGVRDLEADLLQKV